MWPTCKDKTEVRAFLETARQLRMFIKDYAKKAEPLMALTGNVPFVWEVIHDKAMDAIKKGIGNAPCI